MTQVILVGCDLHDDSLVLQVSVGAGAPALKKFGNHLGARKNMVAELRALAQKHSAERIVFAYEASALGFTLYDELTQAGLECHVLAPSKLPESAHRRKRKSDPQDALRVLQVLKAHVLAGSDLPSVWIPSVQLRDDRELVRARMEIADKLTRAKTQIQSLLKRNGVVRPKDMSSWTLWFWEWLNELAYCEEVSGGAALPPGTRRALLKLVREVGWFERERERLDVSLERLAQQSRYASQMKTLLEVRGVGLLTALVFLTELGDVTRFRNRGQVGSYLGLVPSSFESGKANDRKGHITRGGSARLRKVLCQAVWSQIRWDADLRAVYQRICAKNPKKNKIGVVALMRRLGIRLWHRACEALALAA
jgi:transposase